MTAPNSNSSSFCKSDSFQLDVSNHASASLFQSISDLSTNYMNELMTCHGSPAPCTPPVPSQRCSTIVAAQSSRCSSNVPSKRCSPTVPSKQCSPQPPSPPLSPKLSVANCGGKLNSNCCLFVVSLFLLIILFKTKELSDAEAAILRAERPMSSLETEEITVFGQRGKILKLKDIIFPA